MRLLVSLSLATALLLAANAQGAGLYRWVDANGEIHYGDVPAPEVKQAEKKKFSDVTSAPDAALSFEARRAAQNFPVTLYVADNCVAPCQKARDLLSKRGVPYTEKKLVTQAETDQYRKDSASDQTPGLTVGKEWHSGFQLEDWNAALDFAGYPKVAPYRAPAPVPVPKSSPTIKGGSAQ